MIKGIRMLAAIMFTDMVGYTALMQQDEERAKLLRDHHRKVMEDLVLNHQGKIIQYFGDGTLTIFGSVIEAVLCAIDIQNELKKEPKVNLRIGLHSGDIVYDDDGVYGDSVNIASRIEAVAVGGSILVSSKVHDELSNHKDIQATSLGYQEFKNIKTPIKIYALTNKGLTVPEISKINSFTGSDKESLAVLPFLNLTPEPDNEYFSDGITEEILNALSKIGKLFVTSRTSSFAFKGKQVDIREIGKQLGVKNVLEGSVRKFGNRLRVTAQLIDTRSGYHRWTETYDREVENLFELQDSIAKAISKNLLENLTVDSSAKIMVKSPTNNMDAYNLYLKSVHFWKKWTPADVKKSLEYLEQAIKLDDDFAKAYSALAGCYVYLSAMGQIPSQIANPKAKAYALKSIELEDLLPDGHLSLAMVNFFDWKWDDAYNSFIKTLELNPNSAEAHQYFSYYMLAIGNWKKAITESEKALELDPLSIPINTSLGDAYSHCGMFEQAKEQYLKTLELDYSFQAALNGLGWTHYMLGEIDEAIEKFKLSKKLKSDTLRANTALGFIYGRTGNYSGLQNSLEELQDREDSEKDISLFMDYTIIYLGLKNYDKVFEYLNKAYEKKIGGLIFIRGKFWKEIQDDERFKDLISKIGLPCD